MTEPVSAALAKAAELCDAGKPGKAVSVLRPLVAQFPADGLAWARLAAAYLDDGKPGPALEAAQRAAVLDPAHEWPHRLASLALAELGRHDEAVGAAREATRLAPQEWRCHIALAEALAGGGALRDGGTDGQLAVLAARRAVELAPTEPRPFEVLGDIAIRAGRWDIAEQAYLAALRLDPQNQHAQVNLALVKERAKSGPPPAGGTQLPAPGAVQRVLWSPNAIARLTWRLAAALAVGSLAVVIAGLPTPVRGDALFGVALLAIVAVVTVRFVRRIPGPDRRTTLKALRSRPLLAVAVLLLAVGTLLLAFWTLSAALWPGDLQILVVSCLAGGASAGLALLSGTRHAP